MQKSRVMAREMSAKFFEVMLLSLLMMQMGFGTINGVGYTPKPEATITSSSTVIGINQTSGLQLTMSVGNTIYTQGDSVPITFTLTNISNQTINLGITMWVYDFLILNATNGVIFRYATSQCFPQWFFEESLNPGQNLGSTGVWPETCNPSPWNNGVPAPPGTYYIIGQYLNISLPDILVRTPPLQIMVAPGPPQVDVSPCFTRIDIGQYINFSSTVNGITPPYSYQWMLSGANVPHAKSPHWTFIPQSAGTYNVSLTVTTTLGVEYSSNIARVYVNPTMSISPISPANVTCGVNQPLTFAINASGGSTPYQYAWGNGSDLQSALDYANSHTHIITNSTATTFTFTPSSPGNYTVICVVVDTSNGYMTTRWPYSTASVTVNDASAPDPPPSGGGGGRCYLC